MTIVVTPDKMVRALASSVSAGKDAAASGDNPNRELKAAMVAKNFFTDAGGGTGGGTGGNDPRFPDATTASTVLTYKGNGQYAWEITGGGYTPPVTTPPATEPPATRGSLIGYSYREPAAMTLAGMDSDFKTSTGFDAQAKDQLIVSNSTDGTFIYTRTTTAWSNTTRLRVHGDAIVQGTLAVNKLADGSMATPGGMFGLGSGSGAITLGDSYGGSTSYMGSVYGRGIDANKVGGFFLSEKGIALIAATAGTNVPAITGHSRANTNFTGNLTAGYLGIHDRGGSFAYWGNATNAKTGVGLALATAAGIFDYNDVTINKVQRLAHLATSTESGKFEYFSNTTTPPTVITGALLATATHGGYFTGGVGPFTGCHDALIEHAELGTMGPGDIVCDSIVYARDGLIDAITIAVASKSPNEKNAVGVYHRQGDYTPAALAAEDYDRDTYQLISIASVGEGQINVTGENGNLEPGDLITTSSSRGKGMRQDDDIVRSYTVAKCRETVVFDSPDQVKQVACIYMCG